MNSSCSKGAPDADRRENQSKLEQFFPLTFPQANKCSKKIFFLKARSPQVKHVFEKCEKNAFRKIPFSPLKNASYVFDEAFYILVKKGCSCGETEQDVVQLVGNVRKKFF